MLRNHCDVRIKCSQIISTIRTHFSLILLLKNKFIPVNFIKSEVCEMPLCLKWHYMPGKLPGIPDSGKALAILW